MRVTRLMLRPRRRRHRGPLQSQHLWTWCLTRHLLLPWSLPWQSLNLQLLMLMQMHSQQQPHPPTPTLPCLELPAAQ